MADILLDNQAGPVTPAAGKSVLYVDSTGKRFIHLDDGGAARGSLAKNTNTASSAGYAADTYVPNSGLLVPSSGLQAGMIARWFISGSKTAAGLAAATYTIRLGPNQSTVDAALLALVASVVQTAVVDNGLLLVQAILRNVGAAAVLAGVAAWAKTQAGTAGFGGSIDGVSAGFDSTGRAGQFLGLSINGGAAAAWTLTTVGAELIN
jgi:hypothetical protein